MIRDISKYLEHEDLDTFPDQVFQCNLSIDEARNIINGNEVEDFDNSLDEAQAVVHMGKVKTSYLIIKIRA